MKAMRRLPGRLTYLGVHIATPASAYWTCALQRCMIRKQCTYLRS